MAFPTKSILIGSRRFEISGIAETDRYFADLSDNFEPAFAWICDELLHPDYVCLDVGANLGLMTLALSQCVPEGKVVAIEPDPAVAEVLERNITRSGRSNIIAVKTAVGDTNGTVRFKQDSAYGHIWPDGIEVSLRTLPSLIDELSLDRLDFVKIDVEGYEFRILKSSIDLLNDLRSLVLFEFNSWCQIGLSGVNPKEFIEWVLANFSHVFMVRPNRKDGYLERLERNAAIRFLHTNLVEDGTLTNLLVTNFPERLTPSPGRLRAKLSKSLEELDRAAAERDSALAARDAAMAERDAAVSSRNAAIADVTAFRQSTSWWITIPVRALGSFVRSLRRKRQSGKV